MSYPINLPELFFRWPATDCYVYLDCGHYNIRNECITRLPDRFKLSRADIARIHYALLNSDTSSPTYKPITVNLKRTIRPVSIVAYEHRHKVDPKVWLSWALNMPKCQCGSCFMEVPGELHNWHITSQPQAIRVAFDYDFLLNEALDVALGLNYELSDKKLYRLWTDSKIVEPILDYMLECKYITDQGKLC